MTLLGNVEIPTVFTTLEVVHIRITRDCTILIRAEHIVGLLKTGELLLWYTVIQRSLPEGVFSELKKLLAFQCP